MLTRRFFGRSFTRVPHIEIVTEERSFEGNQSFNLKERAGQRVGIEVCGAFRAGSARDEEVASLAALSGRFSSVAE